jgi:diguanylate cyclase (GGDEF)-like protein
MQTANGVENTPFLDPNKEAQPVPALEAMDANADKPAISELLAAADGFNAAFNTALYELEASRKLLRERAARIGELDESIAAINTALREQIEESHREEEAHAAEAQALNQTIHDLETEREQLRQQLAEQHSALKAEREKMAVLRAELETRTNELTEHSARVEALNAELASLTEAGQQRETGHREETERLHAELQSVAEELRDSQTQIEQKNGELEAREGELTALKERTSELEDALDAQALLFREEAESHAKTCQELNENINQVTGEYESLKVIHDELAAHVEKLENLNRALHDSSNSETEVHRKVIAEKDSAISTLKTRLEDATRARKHPEAGADAVQTMTAAQQELERRLPESEEQTRILAERAASADRLEAQVDQLQRELQAQRESGGAAATPSPASEWSLDPVPAQPNSDRARFIARINEVLALPDEEKARHTLLYILLDNFMHVRDEIGVLQSARVIDETFAIIQTSCGANDVVSRFGDCTCAVLCKDAGTDESQAKAEQIRSSIEQHIFEVDGRSLLSSTSIGICALRGNDTNAEEVILRVDLACETARLAGGNRVVMNSGVSDELQLPLSNGRSADIVDRILAENRVKIYYQPISNLKENSVNCFEVLTRVVNENNNVILPAEFFAMAASLDKAVEVDRHVVECVLWKLADKPNPDIKLFIKLTRQSVSSHDLPMWIANKLDEYRINPGQLVFEVPEQAVENDLKNLSLLSRELNKIGCRIAIEHYRMETQPQHLHHIHPEYLKIDRGLVQNITKKGPCLAKVNEILDLAKLNNLKTIAAGVETPACLAILWELGITLAQGYLISEPGSNADFEVFDGDSGNDNEVENQGKAVFTIS